MLNEIIIEEKKVEDGLEQLATKLSCSLEDIYYNVTEQTGNLFKSKKYEITGISKKLIIEDLNNFFQEFSNLSNLELTVDIKIIDDIIIVDLNSSNNAILIGSNGKTLNSFQIYLNNKYSLLRKYKLKINLDIANYKKNKINKFEEEIMIIMNEVLNTQISVKLDSMNSYQRRIVHNLVAKEQSLTTESIGEEPDRYVVIKPLK